MISLKDLFDEADKIWPRKYAQRTFIVLFILISIIGLISYLVEKHNRFKEIEALELNGKIERIMKSEKKYYYYINGIWYGVQNEMNSTVEVNDSLFKERNTDLMILYRNNRKIKEYKSNKGFFKETDLKDNQLNELLKIGR